MSIRTMLIDDEDIARRGLRIRLERAGDIEVVAECPNGQEAIAAIIRKKPDLVFLDIQMPQLSGFQVIEALPAALCPYVVFVTAYDQYAIRAFAVHALDYLLKPVDDDRLAETLRRARGAMADCRSDRYTSRVREAIDGLSRDREADAQRALGERIAIPSGDSLAVVRVSDIDWIQAAGNYVSVHVGKKSWLLRETISAIDQRLAPHGFSRIHRSTLVNVRRVSELKSLANGEFAVFLADGTTLKLSRGYREALDQLIGSRL
jgi:two-component system LytT family response regulator